MNVASFRIALAGLVGAGALLLGPGCQTVPVTGRTQFNVISSAEESELGLRSFEQLKKEAAINHDPAVNAAVQRVGKRVAAAADLPGAQWEFVVFENDEPNAFCLPGGKVGVNTGILPIAKTEAGLAVVIGHEVAHAAAHHGGERMSEAIALNTGSQLIDSRLIKTDPRWREVTAIAYGFGAETLVQLPHSRRQESEADHIGLISLARAGYPPAEAEAFWQRFAEHNRRSGAKTPPAFLRTHPLDETRLLDLRKWMTEAQQAYRPAK